MTNNDPILIVLIEDDDGHARLIEKNLRRAGVSNKIEHVTEGGEGLDVLNRESQPGREILVLLDLNLPDMSGFQVLETIKADERLHRIPVIVLTTTDDDVEKNRCYDLGCSAYVTKPVEYYDFAEALRRLGMFLQVVKVPEIS